MSKTEIIKTLMTWEQFKNWGDTFKKYSKTKLLSILEVAQNNTVGSLDENDTNYIGYYK